MTSLKKYFEELDKKNLFLLYFIFFIGLGLIYYNYNYSVLNKEIEEYENKIKSLEKEIKNVGLLPAKLKRLKKQIEKLEKENLALNEDLKYINILIKSSTILNINEKSFLVILENILKKAISNNIKASYLISEKMDNFKVYTIDIEGNFESQYFYNFYNFIKNLESVRKVKNIQILNLKKTDNNTYIKFYLKINFWSVL
ncbi:MAG TPA: hypothetical protein EYH54_01120 [Nautiliaceae bacterium]|nr:hypothetical protein [Nautiliaceae bacterium]